MKIAEGLKILPISLGLTCCHGGIYKGDVKNRFEKIAPWVK